MSEVDEAAVAAPEAAPAAESRQLTSQEAAIRRQVTYYFSDENLSRGDDFMFTALAASSDGTIPLYEIALFKKMKRLVPDQNLITIADAVYGSPEVEIMRRSDTKELRCRRTRPLTAECALMLEQYVNKEAESQVAERTAVVRNFKKTDEESIRQHFGGCGAIGKIGFGTDERGLPLIRIEYAEPLGAIVAAETLNDEENWRFGVRVALAATSTSPDQLRAKLGLPQAPRKAQPSARRDLHPGNGRRTHNTTNGAGAGAGAGASSSTTDAPNDAINEEEEDQPPPLPECPPGRFRGRLLFVKEPVAAPKGQPKKKGGNYGLLRPLDAESKEDNALFLLYDVVPPELATKLKRGELLEYIIEEGEDGRRRARDVRRVPVPPRKLKPKTEKKKIMTIPRAPPPVDGPNATPLSKLAALAESLDAARHAGAAEGGDENDAAGGDAERPEHLRRFRGMAQQPAAAGALSELVSAAETNKSVIAKGPDGTPGFARPRTFPSRRSSSSLNIDASEFVPGDESSAAAGPT